MPSLHWAVAPVLIPPVLLDDPPPDEAEPPPDEAEPPPDDDELPPDDDPPPLVDDDPPPPVVDDDEDEPLARYEQLSSVFTTLNVITRSLSNRPGFGLCEQTCQLRSHTWNRSSPARSWLLSR